MQESQRALCGLTGSSSMIRIGMLEFSSSTKALRVAEASRVSRRSIASPRPTSNCASTSR
ncbi:hypothetical protein D3C83_304440 [compost metagenome]